MTQQDSLLPPSLHPLPSLHSESSARDQLLQLAAALSSGDQRPSSRLPPGLTCQITSVSSGPSALLPARAGLQHWGQQQTLEVGRVKTHPGPAFSGSFSLKKAMIPMRLLSEAMALKSQTPSSHGARLALRAEAQSRACLNFGFYDDQKGMVGVGLQSQD